MIEVGFLLFPKLTQLDLTGPFEVLALVPGARLHLAAASMAPVTSDSGLAIAPSVTVAECPRLDVLVVPGGPGQVAAMEDEVLLAFVRRQAGNARYVTSVCTGSLILGAAGLLRGKRATCHWLSLDLLPLFGAEPVRERVVRDGRVTTGAGVTAGIDFALALAADIAGESVARRIQAQLEYDPRPPFADPGEEGREAARQQASALLAIRRESAIRAAARLAVTAGSETPSPDAASSA